MPVTPDLINGVFALIAAEFMILSAVLWRARLATLIAPLFFFLASGALLFVCLRAALTGAEGASLAAPAGGSFVAHLAAILFAARAVHRLRHRA